MQVCVLVGNPNPDSRTLKIATMLVEQLLESGTYDVRVIDLAKHAGEVFNGSSESLRELMEYVAACELVVVGSPTYKAAYTGLLKAFLDRYPSKGLRGVVAIPVMTGANAYHSLAPSMTLAPLLDELGAAVPVRGLYYVTTDMDLASGLVSQAASQIADACSHVARLSGRIRRQTGGDPPAR